MRSFVLMILMVVQSSLFAQQYVTFVAKSGDNQILLLKKYHIEDGCSKDQFWELNELNESSFLIIDKKYKLPIKEYKYNQQSIRTTIGITDYNQAKEIEEWNDLLLKEGVILKGYKNGGALWVPEYLLKCYDQDATPAVSENKPVSASGGGYEIFGEKYKSVPIVSDKLKGRVYYIVSGHGGPDPGAMGTCDGNTLCEDEYAYDVALRLARNLISHGALVHVIVRDLNDGIRDEKYLKCDNDEVCYPQEQMPLNQVKRLDQRVNAINKLYKKYSKQGIKYQRMIVIHVDSRGKKNKVDMFFYHNKNSVNGKKMAHTLFDTTKKKYEQFQKNRGYSGTVKDRNLHMLREALPVGVYIELGNIQNADDQKRVILTSNRQAIADWFTDGILLD